MYEYNTALFRSDSEARYYITGLVLADGYISKVNHRIEIALKEDDEQLLLTVRDLVCPGKSLKYKQKQKAWRLTIDNKEIYESVRQFVNELPKSTTLLFPYGIPDKYLPHFIRGYSDGDGNISVKYGRRKLKDGTLARYFGLRYRVLGSKMFLSGLEYNLRRVGVAANQVNVHKKGDENVYYVEYGFSQAQAVLDYIYSDATILLSRKYKVFTKISESDSDTLEKAYGSPEGRYNTPDCSTDGIVGAATKVVE